MYRDFLSMMIHKNVACRVRKHIHAIVLTMGMIAQVTAAVDWPVPGFNQYVTNIFSCPTCISHAGDGSQRLFVAEKAGRIWTIQNSNVLAQPFLDISNRVLNSTGGLLGMAFSPGFGTNGRVYVCYARRSDSRVVVSRFQVSVDSSVVDTNSEQAVLTTGQSFADHNGGQLAFGPDGFLYIGTGDGGPEGDTQNRAQNPRSLLGKLLRIDVESDNTPYTVPANNPFVGNTNYLPEIWALGLRNPKSFAFDRSTGDLYIGDVGPAMAFQEIDFQPTGSNGGRNYGWRIMQGPTNYMVPAGFTNVSALTPPVVWYNYSGLPNCATEVACGRVYRGTDKPRMNGMFFYGDYRSWWMWGMKQDGTNWQTQALLKPNGLWTTNISVYAFGEDESGELYLVDGQKGKVYQLADVQQSWAPVFAVSNGYSYSNTVMVTCLTTNAEIHYTANGIDPTLSDPFVLPGGGIPVTTGVTNKARAFRADLRRCKTINFTSSA
jgi:glucose/arabinose dehydrogenase